MRKELFTKGVLLLGGIMIFCSITAQHLPSKDTLMKQMVTANKYFMDKWPDPGEDIVTDKVRPSNLWTRAVYYEGLMALYHINPDKTYFKYAVDWGRSHDWMPAYKLIFTRDGDHHCCGQTYIELYQLEPDSIQWIAPITMCMKFIVDSDDNDDWSWIDAIQMAMPVLAKLGVVHQDTSYFHKMHEMYMFSKTRHGENGLYNNEDHLWYRDGDFDPPYVTPNNKNCYWSRGNGWVFAALARVLDVIPDTLKYREEYVKTFKEMAGALIAVQREDGFWNPSLADPDHFGSKETSGTAFFTYGLAWGISHGILDSATCIPYVIKGWNAMAYEALHPDGFLGYVQSTGRQPGDGYPFTNDKPANFEDYGLGGFLLAGSETYKLAPDTGSMPAFTIKQDPLSSDMLYINPYNKLNITLLSNPLGENIQLDYEIESSGELEIYILNVLGEIVDFEKIYISTGQDSANFDLNGLPAGMYLARIKFGTFNRTIKFFKSEYLL